MSLASAPVSIPASFKDPAGFLFYEDGVLYRQIHESYSPHYRRLMDSGLYDRLTVAGLLIPHKEVSHLKIRPEKIPFISYPYEWSFGQLKDAALLTLEIQKIALEHGMSLKDASAYNVQWIGSRPVFVDSLSFEIYPENLPWTAYGQFCRHFLAPLALMALCDLRMGRMMRVYTDGVPLDLAARLLPRRIWLNFHLLCHLAWHGHFQKNSQPRISKQNGPPHKISARSLRGILESLKDAVESLQIKTKTEWAAYYEKEGSCHSRAAAHKKELVERYLDLLRPKIVWDLGANTGFFSRLASERGCTTIAMDLDPACVEINYLEARRRKDPCLLPLWMDLAEPSPALGWNHKERLSLGDRAPADLVMALALVHHLAITHNLPFSHLAEYLSRIGTGLLIEFIPKSDPQMEKLLGHRADIFDRYTREDFETEFGRYFEIMESQPVCETSRILYWMRRREK